MKRICTACHVWGSVIAWPPDCATIRYRHGMNLIDYFGRIRIIHLPGRVDRLRGLEKELARIGLSLDDPRIGIPPAPMPQSLNGMPSKAVYGNFLSHLNILKEALADNRRQSGYWRTMRYFAGVSSTSRPKLPHTLVPMIGTFAISGTRERVIFRAS